MKNFDPEIFHVELAKRQKPLLAFDRSADYSEWKSKVREKFKAIIRVPDKTICPKAQIEYEKEVDGHIEIKYAFESEPGYFVPAWLLLPKNISAPVPVNICVAGHSSGVHVYMGIKKFPGDPDGDKSLSRGLYTVEHGHTALLIEQRSFGECEGDNKQAKRYGRCHQTAFQAMLLGRTHIGERAFDISRAIDTLSEFSDRVDLSKIYLSGGSGGGTATYYTSCVEPRIAAAFPACAFCPVVSSIFELFHCQCNYMPDMLKYFDMQDLACLIAPRPLIIFAGEQDPIFPYEATKNAFDNTVKKIYEKEGVPQNCFLSHDSCGHHFTPEIAFADFARVTGWEMKNN